LTAAVTGRVGQGPDDMADVARGVVKRRRYLGHGLLLGAIG